MEAALVIHVGYQTGERSGTHDPVSLTCVCRIVRAVELRVDAPAVVAVVAAAVGIAALRHHDRCRVEA